MRVDARRERDGGRRVRIGDGRARRSFDRFELALHAEQVDHEEQPKHRHKP